MASVQYGSIVTEIKGKTQGHVFQGGNVGFVLRSKGYTPGNPSLLRQAANIALSQNAQAWRALTPSQRTGWESLATTWTFVNRFGVVYVASGFQVFCSANGNLISIGEPTIQDAPTPSPPDNPGAFTITQPTAGHIHANWVNVLPADQFGIFYATASISAGRNLNNLKFRSLVAPAIDGATTNYDLTSSYIAKFGAIQSGMRIAFKMVTFLSAYPRAVYQQITSYTI